MLRKYLLILVTLAIVQRSYQSLDDNEVDGEDTNPWAEAASAVLKEQNVQNIGSMVSSFLENGGAKHIGDLLGNIGPENAANLLSNLDPSMIASAVNLFAANNDYQKPVKEGGSRKTKGGSLNVVDMISAATQLFGQGGGGGEGNPLGEGMLQLLPTLLSSVGSFVGPEADERARSHSGHSSLMPPILEKIHIYFDHFLHSDIGKQLINMLGAEKIFNIFTDEKGRFDYNKFGEMLENHSFRKHWIRMATDRLATILKAISDPTLQKQYLSAVPLVANAFLMKQGFPTNVKVDLNKPTESITSIVNHVSKQYLGFKINSKEYVKPAVEYLQDMYKLSQKSGFLNNPRELSDKLADTINLEIIEPLARVNRAYRFAKNVPACDKYVICLVNEENQNDPVQLPELKKMLYKGSSLIASWFISGHTGTPFWTLYEIVNSNQRCKKLYSEKCHDFHIEEVKVTTEYVHNEL